MSANPGMQSTLTAVRRLFSQAMRKAFPSVKQDPIITTSNPKFGDYQCNNAMSLFKLYGASLGKSPRDIADKLAEHIPTNEILENVTVAPAGFVTVKLSSAWLAQQLMTNVLMVAKTEYKDAVSKRVVVDFSSPNIAKEMHVGHLRSTILGETTCRILEMCGHDVLRLNHVGDWGTQFGMLIEYMKEEYPDFQKSMPDISDLQGFYRAAKKRFDEDPDFKTRSQLSVVALQKGDAYARDAWQMICDVSRKSFEEIYKRLDVTLEERGESFYNEMIPSIVKELEARGLMEESEGAKCIFCPRVDKVPLMVVKRDGGYGYDSTDMAAIYHRLYVERGDWLIYLTDVGQETHFHKIFDAARQAGWHRENHTRLDHAGFGLVQGADGKKFKTRSGDVTKLTDLLDEAAERAEQELKRRMGEDADNASIDEAELKEAARRLGYGAIRYFDLKQNRTTNYQFSYDKMLDPKGNTAVYLFYAYARICSIQRKAGYDRNAKPTGVTISHVAERDLILAILRFPDVIESILSDLYLHKLAEYMYELSNLLTAFYQNCKVIGSDEQESRLQIAESTRKVLHQCFFLLGIQPLERI